MNDNNFDFKEEVSFCVNNSILKSNNGSKRLDRLKNKLKKIDHKINEISSSKSFNK